MADASLWDNPDQLVAATMPQSTAPGAAPADENAKSQRLVTVDASRTRPVESALLEDHQMPSRSDEGSMALKLRPQYTSNILEEVLGFGTAVDSEIGRPTQTCTFPDDGGIRRQ